MAKTKHTSSEKASLEELVYDYKEKGGYSFYKIGTLCNISAATALNYYKKYKVQIDKIKDNIDETKAFRTEYFENSLDIIKMVKTRIFELIQSGDDSKAIQYLKTIQGLYDFPKILQSDNQQKSSDESTNIDINVNI